MCQVQVQGRFAKHLGTLEIFCWGGVRGGRFSYKYMYMHTTLLYASMYMYIHAHMYVGASTLVVFLLGGEENNPKKMRAENMVFPNLDFNSIPTPLSLPPRKPDVCMSVNLALRFVTLLCVAFAVLYFALPSSNEHPRGTHIIGWENEKCNIQLAPAT